MHWYPIKLTAHIRRYAFGERAIVDRLHKQDLPEGRIAETWEISDYRDTTGTVKNGELSGKTLHELVQRYPAELVGQNWQGPHFPLLAKFLDASHMLPVHLHADDETAARIYREPNGKTEAWHILWAAPGATVLAGLKGDDSRDRLFDSFVHQDYDAVIVRHPIQPGDTIYVPGGIIHSFGPDALVFEIQQTSDLGRSVMPEDLYGQPLSETDWHNNINATLDELQNHYHPRPHSGLAVEQNGNRRVYGCAGPYFVLERWTLTAPYHEPAHPHRCTLLSNVGQHPVALKYEGGTEKLDVAESCILPAAIGSVEIVPQPEASLVVCYVPDLQIDVIEPLTAAGYSQADIQQLGQVQL